MKKSLLATTALAMLGAVSFAGAASAGAERIKVGVGGYMEQWFGFADSSNNVNRNNTGFDQKTDAEIHFKGETLLDNGIKVGINVQLEAQTDGDQIDEQYLYVDGAYGRFLMGSENSASYLMHYGIPSHGATLDSGDITDWIAGGDFDMSRTNGRGVDNDSEKLTYFTPRFSGFQLGVSYVPELNQDNDAARPAAANTRNDSVAVAANFDRSFGDFKLMASAGYQHFGELGAGTKDLESYQFGLRLGFAGFTVAGTYGEEDQSNGAQVFTATQDTYGLGISYAAGDMGVSFAYIGARGGPAVEDDDQDAFELGAKYALGPGVDLKGSLYYLERETRGVDTAKGFAVVGGLDLSF